MTSQNYVVMKIVSLVKIVRNVTKTHDIVKCSLHKSHRGSVCLNIANQKTANSESSSLLERNP